MDDLPRDPFDALPHYAERLRAEFEPLPHAPDADTCAQLEHEASALLMSLLAIEENAVARSGDDETESGPEFQRLERKLDLVLELLSARLFEASAPSERNVQMSAAGARWALGGSAPAPGSAGIVSIYVHRLLPRALRLPAEVLHDEAGWLRLRFLEVGEACRELLVRHVFQQHRRHLAGTRRAQRTP
ncbi:PilZ domain-containing protein [Panacagrimonas perspica]|nr:PilZ domain-containing protein [Panacagrimonas perspica]